MRKSCRMCLTASVECVSECVEEGRDRLHQSVEVYRKRPRNWAKDKGTHVFPTKRVGVNKGDDKRPEYWSRLCGKELKRWDLTMPGAFASMGPFECVMLLLTKALMWKIGRSGATTRKILFLDASRAHCQAEATSEMSIELPPEGEGRRLDRTTHEVVERDT